VAANAADLPQLADAQERLELMLTELRELLAQQAALRASKQQVSKRLRTLAAGGRKVVTMVQSVLKERYGHGNDKLLEFGVQPRRARRQRSEPGPEPPAPLVE
jgi:hypothetical protein